VAGDPLDLFCCDDFLYICYYRLLIRKGYLAIAGMANNGKQHIHLIGIGGAGLSAIALVLLESGYDVSGSDRQLSPLAKRVQAAGGRVTIGHSPENVLGANLVVRSSAIPDDNVEVQAALAAGLQVLKRADFLDRLMASHTCLAVAGTHGKTTTTAMLAWILTALACDPSYIIGGVSSNLGNNAHAGGGPFFVIEADEYDRMFLGLHPYLAVITNIEHDHPDCYPSPEDFYQAFVQFADQLAPGGILLACADDPGAARLLKQAEIRHSRTFAYGISDKTSVPDPYQATNLARNERGGFDFDFLSPNHSPIRIRLRVPGEHNVRNALAVLATADLLGLPLDEASRALEAYRGTSRRFEVRGEAAQVTVIDDYAHHPTEIRATLAAARVRYGDRRIWAVWQPHTFSRTRALLDGFATAFGDADRVLVTEIFPAREKAPADGFSARQVVAAINTPLAFYTPDPASAREFLLERLQPGDVLLVLSAGDADLLSRQILEGLTAQHGEDSHKRIGEHD
jgi:UDP-N-acetylmuramate--alanine ligase